jgi:L-cysteine desulfidase
MSTQAPTFTVKDLLRTEVAPALGCTEPVAIALAAASAAALVRRDHIDRISVRVDGNIYKNGVAVSIPGTAGLRGLDLAAAIGAFGGDPARRLEVLAPISAEVVDRAEAFVQAGGGSVQVVADTDGLYVQALVTAGDDVAECLIRDFHDNIVGLRLNGRAVEGEGMRAQRAGEGAPDVRAVEAWLKPLTLRELFDLLDGLDEQDLEFLEQGVNVNLRLAEHGLKYGDGLGIGKTLERLVRQRMIQKDMVLAARILTSAASDARMAGVKLPAMSSAGSGNHGLTATLPIRAVEDYVTCPHAAALEAVALSHIITAYVKAYTGRLSALCGCSIAAGAGAAAGVVHLLGGGLSHVAGAITNLVEDLAGVICDGAKAGCSLKLATAAGTAVQSALFALQGVRVQATDGIIGASPERTLQNVGELSTRGMVEADRTILGIMLAKRFRDPHFSEKNSG